MNTVKETGHKKLLSDVIKAPLAEEDGLAWMILLHTHEIHVRSQPLADDAFNEPREVTILAPETQRGAAQIVAALWPDETDAKHRDPSYWYRKYNTSGSYEALEDVPEDLRQRVLRVRELLAQHPCIVLVAEEAE